jgi:hypothetical protein
MDEDSMDQRLAQALRARGVDVQAALDASMVERADEDHLAHAAEQDRVLYSFNVEDFYRLHTRFLEQGRTHAGVVLARNSAMRWANKCGTCLRLWCAKRPRTCATALSSCPPGRLLDRETLGTK